MAQGQTLEDDLEEAGALLFNSVYIGLDPDTANLEPQALAAAIDHELEEDPDIEGSWQSLPAPHVRSAQSSQPSRGSGKQLTRSKGPTMEFKLTGLSAEIDQYYPTASLRSRILVAAEDLEILDHIKTSTWQKFLTSLRSDSKGNVRETGSNMVRIEYRVVCPVQGHSSEEARLRVSVREIIFLTLINVTFRQKSYLSAYT